MIPTVKFIEDSMTQLRNGQIIFVFYPEQVDLIEEQCQREGLLIHINRGSWIKAIYLKEEDDETILQK